MDDVKLILGIIAFFVAIVVLLVVLSGGLLVLGNYYLERPLCYRTAEAAELEAKWQFWGGCFVKIDDRWIPYSRWAAVEHTPLD